MNLAGHHRVREYVGDPAPGEDPSAYLLESTCGALLDGWVCSTDSIAC